MPEEELPTTVVDDAVRLTRWAHRVDGEEAAQYRDRRDTLLAEYGYTAHVRTDDDPPTVVLHPRDWLVDGTVRRDRIEDTDNAIERALTGGAIEDYDAATAANEAIVARVADAHAPVHADTAAAFATFMENHRARPLDTATAADIQEFLEEYFPRNSWPTDEQRRLVCRSLRYTLEIARRHG
ncbi:MAG: rnhA operon protein [Halobacteriaceae archaeon]